MKYKQPQIEIMDTTLRDGEVSKPAVCRSSPMKS